jgi:hypothetical protein
MHPEHRCAVLPFLLRAFPFARLTRSIRWLVRRFGATKSPVSKTLSHVDILLPFFAMRRIAAQLISLPPYLVCMGALLSHRCLCAPCQTGLPRLLITAHLSTSCVGSSAAAYEASIQAGLRPVKNSPKGALLTSNPEFSRPCRSAFI